MPYKNPEEHKEAVKRYRDNNRDKVNAYARAYYASKPEANKRRHYFKEYPQATEEQYQHYLKTTHCECCNKEFKNKKYKKCQDHDHLTGAIRGVICNSCNAIDGYIESLQHLEQITKYIKEHREEEHQ